MIGDTFLFLPEFNDFSYYLLDLLPQDSMQVLVPEFTWPIGAGAGSASVLAALTNPEMTEIMWNIAQYDFTWSE